jgi:hypothetical protein
MLLKYAKKLIREILSDQYFNDISLCNLLGTEIVIKYIFDQILETDFIDWNILS